jgi:adenylate cyclase
MADDLDIIQKVFQHRLQQSNMEGILAVLSSSEREVLIDKIGALLQRISALVEVSNKVSDTLSLDILLPRLIEIISESLNADRSTLFLHDPETNELFSRTAQGSTNCEIRFPAHMGIAGSVFTTGEPIIIPDAYADPRFNQEVDKKTGYRTRNILCTPIFNKEHDAIGVAQVLNKANGDFDDEDNTLLTALTSQAANALENATLFETVQRQQRDESQLLEITSAISSDLQIKTLLSKVVSVTTDMLDADRSTLFRYDNKANELWSRVAEGLDVKEICFPSNAGIPGSAFTLGSVINIADAYADERFNQDVDKETGYRTFNMLCMPIANKDGMKIGVMQVLKKKTGAFGITDENRLRAFSAQVAIALENARLFEEVLNEKNYSESILRSLSDGVVTRNAEEQVLKVNEAGLKILQWELDAVLNRSIADLLDDEANHWILESLRKVQVSGARDLSMDADLRLANGDKVAANVTCVPLIDISDTPIGYMLIIEDITTEKRVKSTMSRYMPKELADKLIEEGEDALRGNAQIATVLFSDIRSFTSISESMGARDTASMLNDYFSRMMDVILQHGGMLDKYIGDAIMALFGAPFPSDQDADKAMQVGNQMMRALRELNEQRLEAGKNELDIGIGVNTGELFAGNIGSPKRMDYTAIGDTVNLAARLEGATKYYGVKTLFSEFTKAALTQNIASRDIDLIRIKGKQLPVSVFEALDHHIEETFPNMLKAVGVFAAGIAEYRQRQWAPAGEAFNEVLSLAYGDRPAELYAERARHYLHNPPAEDWDYVWVMETK